MHHLVREQIRRRRKMLRAATGRNPARRMRRRLPRQNEPKTVEASYYSAVERLLERARELLQKRLVPRLPDLVEAARAARGDASRHDAGSREVNKLLAELEAEYTGRLIDSELENLAAEFAIRTSEAQQRELSKQLQAATGVEVPFADRGIRQRIEDFTAENVSLIKSIPRRFFDQVEQRVIAGVREGTRWEEIAGQLEERFGVAKKSAALVARDQVGKFYGELQKARQNELGIDAYIWRTSNDNRVRPEHEEREGKRFKWSDPPEDGHPGHAINCRCYAEPDLSAILEGLDRKPEDDAPVVPRQREPEPEPREPVFAQPPVREPEPVGNVAGDKGEYVRKLHPKLARTLGDQLEVNASRTYSVELQDLDMLPEKVLTALRAGGVKVQIGRGGSLDIATGMTRAILKDDKPRGWAPGSTWADVGGVYSPATNTVIIGDKIAGAKSLALHEVGHAVDFNAGKFMGGGFKRYSDHADFQRAYRGWEDDRQKLREAEQAGDAKAAEKYRAFAGRNREHPYFTKQASAEANRQETFAEAFGEYWQAGGGDKGRDAVEKAFGRTIADWFNSVGQTDWKDGPW